MRDAVICEPLRTPVGGFGGALRDVPRAEDLASTVIRALMERTGLPPESVDDVLLGNCYPTMESPAVGRVAALDAGLPVPVGGLQIDRRCGSGLQAVINAAMAVQTGASEVVLAGGAESMSNAAFYSTAMRWGVTAGPGVQLHDALARGRVTAGGVNFPVPGGMIETAENLRAQYGISREEQDECAVRSHQQAAAVEAGVFAEEIVPVTVTGRAGDTVVDLVELNEAFASQVLACTREWGFAGADFERMNVHGSGISLGHPVGATGGRILATLTREMARREARYGLETMCIGGGQGLAALVERV